MTRNEMIKVLSENKAEVTFTKVDGSQRVMTCTLKSDLVPASDHKPESNRTVNESVLPVWDLDKLAWRSFRVDSVTQVVIK